MPEPKNTVTDTPQRDNPVLEFVSPRIDEERWADLQSRIWSLLNLSVSNRSEMDSALKVWNDLYEGVTPAVKDWPWPNASNLHVPLTSEMVDGLHSRLAKATIGISPLTLVKGKDRVSMLFAPKGERYYDSFTKRTHTDEVISESIFLALRDGVGLMKTAWEERKRRVKVRKYKPLLNQDGTPMLDPLTEKPAVQESTEVIELTEYDDVRVVPVELKDFYLIPAHAYSIDRFGSGAAKGCAHRVWVRWDEINRRAKAKIYNAEAVERLRTNTAGERASTPEGITGDVTAQGLIQVQQPLTEDESGSGLSDKEFELFEIFMAWDLNKDGYEEECIFTIAKSQGVLLRADIFPYWHQRRPFVAIIPWRRPRRFYGFSIVHRIEPLQREVNTIHNQRVDAVNLYLSPPLKITKGAWMRGDVSQPWGPGAKMEVENADDVSLLQMPEINPSAWTEETLIRQYAERLIGLYDINTPRGSGARRTRAEIGAIQQEGMVRFDYMMKNIQRAIVDLYDMIHQLKIQYMPEEEPFESVIGPDGQPTIEAMSRQEMAMANIEFRANGDLPVADKQESREEAYFLYNTLSASPLVAMNIEHQYALAKALLEAWDRRDIEDIIGTRDEARAFQQQQMQMQQMMAQSGMMGGGGGGGGQQRVPSRPRR